jgi:hypothetical protein
MDLETIKLKLPKSERQLWRVYLTDHLGKPPRSYDPSIRIKFTSTKTVYKVLVDGELVLFADYSKGKPIFTVAE